MHRNLFAPLVSATLRRSSCWSISASLEDFDEAPALRLRRCYWCGGRRVACTRTRGLLPTFEVVASRAVELLRALQRPSVQAGTAARSDDRYTAVLSIDDDTRCPPRSLRVLAVRRFVLIHRSSSPAVLSGVDSPDPHLGLTPSEFALDCSGGRSFELSRGLFGTEG